MEIKYGHLDELFAIEFDAVPEVPKNYDIFVSV